MLEGVEAGPEEVSPRERILPSPSSKCLSTQVPAPWMSILGLPEQTTTEGVGGA